MQLQSFLGMGVQHQNSKAERAMQTIMYMACTFLVHSSLHWMDMGADDISLRPFAVKHAVWLYNLVPNQESGLTPLELLTKQNSTLKCGVVRRTCSNLSSRMARSFPSMIDKQDLADY